LQLILSEQMSTVGVIFTGLNPYLYLLHLFTELPSVLTKNADADLSRFFHWTEEVQEKCKYACAKRKRTADIAGVMSYY